MVAQQALGEIYFSQKDYQLAKQRYTDALKLNPDAPLTHFRLGRVEDILGNWEDAVTYYKHSAYLNPKDFNPYQFLGEGYFFRKQLDEAKANYEKAIELGSSVPWVRFKLGQIARQQKNELAAIGYFQEAIRLNEKNPSFHQFLGEAYFAQQKYDLAKASYQKAIELGTSAPWVRFKLGRVAQIQNNSEDAQLYFEKAIALNPKNPQFHYFLGFLQAQQSQIDDARASYEKALSLNPNHKPSQKGLEALKKANAETLQSDDTTTIETLEVVDEKPEDAIFPTERVATQELEQTDSNSTQRQKATATSTTHDLHSEQSVKYKIVPTEVESVEEEPHPNGFVEKIWQRLFG